MASKLFVEFISGGDSEGCAVLVMLDKSLQSQGFLQTCAIKEFDVKAMKMK